jgi:rod shape-determining protein MreD
MGAEATRAGIAGGEITGGEMKRKLAAVIALTAVVLVQLTIVNGLALPGGGTPDLVLLCVIALGMAGGPAVGVIAGFCAGLALDLAPPASQLVGQYALVLCLVGYGAGRLRFTLRQSALLALAAAAGMAALGEAMAAGLALILDTPDVSWASAARVLPPSVLLDIALSPLTLFLSVRLAVALGMTVSPLDDSPVLETGGSAAPATVAALTGEAGMARVNGARIGGMPRGGQRRAAVGDSLAAATGRWLVGDVAEAVPAIGAIGWLAPPARSRRARRRQARLTAMLTGASPRKGAFWVGRRPPGLLPIAPLVRPSADGLARLRPGGAVAGSAVAVPRPGQTGRAWPGRAIHLGLADEQGKRARSGSRRARVTWLAAAASGRGGLDRFAANGVLGRDVPRIAFGTGGLPGAGRAAGRPVPRIAFGTGGLPGAGRAAGRPVPRIAFGTGGLPGAERAAGRPVPRIAFGTGGLPGAGRAAGRPVPRIAFGTGALPGAGRAAGRPVPRIAFGTGALPGAGRAARPVPRIAFGSASPGSAARAGLAPPAAAPEFSAPGPLGSSYRGIDQFGTGYHGGGTARSGRSRRQPRFARSTSGHQPSRSRHPKTARMSAGRGVFRRLPWMRRAGDRSAVWRIGSRRMSGLR